MKYSREALRGMAQHALKCRRAGSPLWQQIVLAMMLRTGLSADDIECGIVSLAQ